MNREIEGTQQTVLFYVDDIKLSHRNKKVLLDTAKDLAARYGEIKDLTVTRGDVHNFLGVTLDFREKKKLKIKMDGYVKEVIDEADAKLKTKQRDQAKTPASMVLFKINSTSPELNKKGS